MSAKEDAMIARYHERRGKLDEYLRGETGPVPRELWHEFWIERPSEERAEYERGR